MPLVFAVLSILTAWGVHNALEALKLSALWWLDVPSVMGFYGFFYGIFDRWVWRVPLLRTAGLVKVPEISGTWEGYVTSSFDEGASHHAASLEILQTWTRLRITLQTASSESRSLTAAILTGGPGSMRISYEYVNTPRPHARSTMHVHRGTARHTLHALGDTEELDGEYYTGRDRETFGELHFSRLSENR